MIRIILVAGHGAGSAHNRGGVCYNEGDNNFYFSLVLKKELEKYEGVEVDLLRKIITDNPSLAARSKAGEGYDASFHLHSNGFSNPEVRGSEVWDSVEKPNKTLAQAIVDATAELFQHNNRGVKYKEGQSGWNWYAELRLNRAKSSMIIESGFHTNKLDCSFYLANHEKVAEVQAAAIANHYGLSMKEEVKPAWKIQMEEEWARGIALGITSGTDPGAPATRSQVVSMIIRALDKGGE